MIDSLIERKDDLSNAARHICNAGKELYKINLNGFIRDTYYDDLMHILCELSKIKSKIDRDFYETKVIMREFRKRF